MAVGRNGLITALDIGSTKIVCFIARPDGAGGARVIGIGHQVSKGMRAGTVVDMEAAEEAVRAAVDAAERMAKETVYEVIVGFSGGRPASRIVEVEVDIAGHEIGERDLKRALDRAHLLAREGNHDREVVNALPAGYCIDGTPGYREPRGMFGSRLGLNLHVVSTAAGPMRNLRLLAERCHLEIASLVISPYASGLSTLVEDEMDLGVTLIDMGGGSTDVAVFYDGHMVHTEQVPVGGNHVTNDIARGLSTPASHAERLKTLHGSAVAGPDDERAMVTVPRVGESGADAIQQIPRSMLIGIIQPRIEETLELVRDRLETGGFARMAGRRAVLTGGGALLTGVREHAARVLDKQVRVGRPLGIHGLAEATEGPAFATAAGLLVYSERGPRQAEIEPAGAVAEGGRMVRLGRWFKENF
ncbi:MAG: cell division protein FtsA [Alphaproteobacteria bacterium]|jgi:cell division protein FtsA|nr:cell division protein FtsA [Alphaproteobacteria bacterium]MDP6566355.1 cell division protein FtsA [Alphaproteobacteria bacterium]MDP6812515.1 cell division protein FtsA [Alphaproteobacteria bacterium]